MKIELEVPDHHVKQLRFWASLRRTLEEATRLLEECDEISVVHEDALTNCVAELRDITPAIEDLHYAFKSAMFTRVHAAMQDPTPEQRKTWQRFLGPEEIKELDRLIDAKFF